MTILFGHCHYGFPHTPLIFWMRMDWPPRFPNFPTFLQGCLSVPSKVLVGDLCQGKTLGVVYLINKVRSVSMIVGKRIEQACFGWAALMVQASGPSLHHGLRAARWDYHTVISAMGRLQDVVALIFELTQRGDINIVITDKRGFIVLSYKHVRRLIVWALGIKHNPRALPGLPDIAWR